VQEITFTNPLGYSISAGYQRGDYFLNALEGIGGIATDIRQEKAPLQHGETVTAKTFRPREVSFELGIAGSMNEIYDRRHRLMDVFNPALGPGTLIYKNDRYQAKLQAEAVEAPDFPSGERYMPGGMHVGVIRLRAIENVFFTTLLPGYQMLAAVTPLFEFDTTNGFQIPIDENGAETLFEVGTLSLGTMVVNNTGHVPAPIEVTIYGPVDTPRLTNVTTGEFIELGTPLQANERMVIYTDYGQKSAVIYRDNGETENAFQYLNIEETPESPEGSTYFQLRPGHNELQFDASAGSETATVEVRYWLKFIGY
jgi:hypothetical protein